MKMMNTEMEFVAFDAQDVIATSGGFTKVSYITGTREYPYLSGYDGDPNKQVILSSGGDDYYIMNIQGASLVYGNLYQGTTQAGEISDISSIPGYENAELDPININTFENYGALIEWLSKASNGLFGQ